MTNNLVRRDVLAVLESERLRDPDGRGPTVALVEIDRFPELSDLHGRAFCEHMMQQLVELVRGLVHERDVVGRFYDDRVVIVMHPPDAPAAERSAEAIRAAIEDHGFEPGGLRVEASIGFDEAGGLDEARMNLRRARLLGGNQVVSRDGVTPGLQVVPWPDDELEMRLPPRRAD